MIPGRYQPPRSRQPSQTWRTHVWPDPLTRQDAFSSTWGPSLPPAPPEGGQEAPLAVTDEQRLVDFLRDKETTTDVPYVSNGVPSGHNLVLLVFVAISEPRRNRYVKLRNNHRELFQTIERYVATLPVANICSAMATLRASRNSELRLYLRVCGLERLEDPGTEIPHGSTMWLAKALERTLGPQADPTFRWFQQHFPDLCEAILDTLPPGQSVDSIVEGLVYLRSNWVHCETLYLTIATGLPRIQREICQGNGDWFFKVRELMATSVGIGVPEFVETVFGTLLGTVPCDPGIRLTPADYPIDEPAMRNVVACHPTMRRFVESLVERFHSAHVTEAQALLSVLVPLLKILVYHALWGERVRNTFVIHTLHTIAHSVDNVSEESQGTASADVYDRGHFNFLAHLMWVCDMIHPGDPSPRNLLVTRFLYTHVEEAVTLVQALLPFFTDPNNRRNYAWFIHHLTEETAVANIPTETLRAMRTQLEANDLHGAARAVRNVICQRSLPLGPALVLPQVHVSQVA